MPPTLADLSALMADLGPACPAIEQVIQDAEAGWTVWQAGGARTHLSLRDHPARLELATPLGTLPRDTGQPAQALLMFNFLSRDNAGARMALCEPDQRVYLLADLPVADLDLPTLCDALLAHAGRAAPWRAFLAAGGSRAQPALPPLPPAHLLRQA